MNHREKIIELQKDIVNLSSAEIEIKSEVDDYDIEGDGLDVYFYTDKLTQEEFVNKIFTILNQIDLSIICAMQLKYIHYNKETKECTTNISFAF